MPLSPMNYLIEYSRITKLNFNTIVRDCHTFYNDFDYCISKESLKQNNNDLYNLNRLQKFLDSKSVEQMLESYISEPYFIEYEDNEKIKNNEDIKTLEALFFRCI